MRRIGATTSWGSRLVVGALVPFAFQTQVPPVPTVAPPSRAPGAAAAPPAPVPTPYEQTWAITVDVDRPTHLVADVHQIFVAGSTRLLASKLEDGTEAWRHDYHEVTALTADADRVLVGADGALRALDPSTGKSLWTVTDTGDPTQIVSRAGWVVASVGSTLGAFRATDGSLVWRETLGATVLGSPGIDGDGVFVLLSSGQVVRLAMTTGESVWQVGLDAGSTNLLAANDLVYLSMSDGGFVAYAQKDGHFRWRYPARAPAIGLPISDTAHVYLAFQDNTIQALSRYIGNQSWQAQLTERPPTGPALISGDVLLPAEDGDIGMARRNNGHIEGHIPAPPAPPSQSSASPHLIGLETAPGDVIVRLMANPDTTTTLAAFHRTPKAKKDKSPDPTRPTGATIRQPPL